MYPLIYNTTFQRGQALPLFVASQRRNKEDHTKENKQDNDSIYKQQMLAWRQQNPRYKIQKVMDHCVRFSPIAYLISRSLTSKVSWLLAGMPGRAREP